MQVVENRSGIIAVDATGTVYGHGMYDGRFNTDLVRDTTGSSARTRSRSSTRSRATSSSSGSPPDRGRR